MKRAPAIKQLFKGTGQDIARLAKQAQAEARNRDRAAYAESIANQQMPPVQTSDSSDGPTPVQ